MEQTTSPDNSILKQLVVDTTMQNHADLVNDSLDKIFIAAIEEAKKGLVGLEIRLDNLPEPVKNTIAITLSRLNYTVNVTDTSIKMTWL